jgi:hypothetical protein
LLPLAPLALEVVLNEVPQIIVLVLLIEIVLIPTAPGCGSGGGGGGGPGALVAPGALALALSRGPLGRGLLVIVLQLCGLKRERKSNKYLGHSQL